MKGVRTEDKYEEDEEEEDQVEAAATAPLDRQDI